MTIKLTKLNYLVLGVLSGFSVVSLGVLPGNAKTSPTQTNKTPMHATSSQQHSSTSSTGAKSPTSSSMQSAAKPSGVLSVGSTGQAVKDLQTSLKKLGFYNGPISGSFGHQTQQAVIEFQRSKKLTPDGVVGPKTQAELKA